MRPVLSHTSLVTVLLVTNGLAATSPAQQPREHVLEVACDARVELMSILMRMAGAREYKAKSATSPYSRAVDDWFSPFTNHAAVRHLVSMRQNYGIGYDAPMSLAVHLKSVAPISELISFDLPPERLDERWDLRETRVLIPLLTEFVKESSFEDFIEEQEDFYAKCAARMRAKLKERSYLPWLSSFFGGPPGSRFQVIPGLLNGGGSYGVGVTFADQTEFISPVIGIHSWDRDGLPLFNAGFVPTVVHEFVHSYTNPLVVAHWQDLRASAERMFPHCEGIMSLQAYSSPEIVMYESMVRASVQRYLRVNDTAAAADEHLNEQVRRGFVWTEKLAGQLERYENEREQYPQLGTFMPQIASFFESYSKEYETRMTQAPHVLSISPDPARLVDPSVGELVIAFDRPMSPDSYAIIQRGKSPEFGAIAYDSGNEVLRVAMRLEPDTKYSLSLNDRTRHGFRSANGLILDPVMLSFVTASK